MPKKKTVESVTHPQSSAPRRPTDGFSTSIAPAKAANSVRRKRVQAVAGAKRKVEIANDHPDATLKERVELALNHLEPLPTASESEAIRFAISIPGLLDEVREQAFLALAAVVEHKLAEHGRRLSQSEAANVAWWIVGHPDDVPDA